MCCRRFCMSVRCRFLSGAVQLAAAPGRGIRQGPSVRKSAYHIIFHWCGSACWRTGAGNTSAPQCTKDCLPPSRDMSSPSTPAGIPPPPPYNTKRISPAHLWPTLPPSPGLSFSIINRGPGGARKRWFCKRLPSISAETVTGTGGNRFSWFCENSRRA